MNIPAPVIRDLGRVDYQPTWDEMKSFTDARSAATADELWFLEHPPVFTQGLNGKPEHLLDPGDIPVIKIDRGGQVTYHGPGQIVVYTLVDIKRLKLGVRGLVEALENAIIDTLAAYGIEARNRCDAPGVYTLAGAKVASLGLRIRHGAAYHGLAFNVNMDLAPFRCINPCGMADLEVTQVADLGGPSDPAQVRADLEPHLLAHLGYTMRPRNTD